MNYLSTHESRKGLDPPWSFIFINESNTYKCIKYTLQSMCTFYVCVRLLEGSESRDKAWLELAVKVCEGRGRGKLRVGSINEGGGTDVEGVRWGGEKAGLEARLCCH